MIKHINKSNSLKLFVDFEKIIKYGTINCLTKNTPICLASLFLPKADDLEDYGCDDLDIYYGEIVFSFRNNILDGFSIPVSESINGGVKAKFDLWEFEDYNSLTLLYVEGMLNNESVDFHVERNPDDDEIVDLYIPQSGITLSFWADEELPLDEVFNYHLAYIFLL